MMWEQLIWYAAIAVMCWVAGAVLAFRSSRRWTAAVASMAGSAVFLTFIIDERENRSTPYLIS